MTLLRVRRAALPAVVLTEVARSKLVPCGVATFTLLVPRVETIIIHARYGYTASTAVRQTCPSCLGRGHVASLGLLPSVAAGDVAGLLLPVRV